MMHSHAVFKRLSPRVNPRTLICRSVAPCAHQLAGANDGIGSALSRLDRRTFQSFADDFVVFDIDRTCIIVQKSSLRKNCHSNQSPVAYRSSSFLCRHSRLRLMALVEHSLRGACSCGRNQYIVLFPQKGVEGASVYFDSSSESRK